MHKALLSPNLGGIGAGNLSQKDFRDLKGLQQSWEGALGKEVGGWDEEKQLPNGRGKVVNGI